VLCFRFAQIAAPNVVVDGLSIRNGKSPDTSGGGGLLISKHVDIGKEVLGATVQDAASMRLGASSNITYHMWLRINEGKRAASIFQLGAANLTRKCDSWHYMISLEMTYAPGDVNGYLHYWVTDERVSETTPVYSARSRSPFPTNSWVHLVLIHSRDQGLIFYIDGQTVPLVHSEPRAFPPNVYRNMLNFNGGRPMVGAMDRCVAQVDDRTAYSISDFYMWNRLVLTSCMYACMYSMSDVCRCCMYFPQCINN
jgi:hypothetical protein